MAEWSMAAVLKTVGGYTSRGFESYSLRQIIICFSPLPQVNDEQRSSCSFRQLYIRWIMDAKKPETRMKRIQKTVQLAAQNKKPGMM